MIVVNKLLIDLLHCQQNMQNKITHVLQITEIRKDSLTDDIPHLMVSLNSFD